MSDWLFLGQPVDEPPLNAVGFIYRIERLDTGRKYIGKKLLQFKRTKQVKGVKKKMGGCAADAWIEVRTTSSDAPAGIRIPSIVFSTTRVPCAIAVSADFCVIAFAFSKTVLASATLGNEAIVAAVKAAVALTTGLAFCSVGGKIAGADSGV
jgi:hypothetical protein